MAKTFGASLLVGVGWFVTAVIAAAVGEWSVPEQPDRDCSGFGACLSLLDILPVIVFVAGVPLLLVLLLAVTAAVTRLKLPAALAGTLSAALTAAVVGAGVALYGATR
ncbi:hypothetical protein ACFO1B_52500 [Dactylosporangium siamense]|uniref:Uncharacterized protein n=1 Tax=Dactylosporangium siamense TaxID=685454 RepID=A0A919U5G5_9ACTN|nr:hypothetical protein [Dactylosporangium siamense]GIG42312.1 hypothetical protein Dsi01nite_003530 [Dactylosporangium siamense]